MLALEGQNEIPLLKKFYVLKRIYSKKFIFIFFYFYIFYKFVCLEFSLNFDSASSFGSLGFISVGFSGKTSMKSEIRFSKHKKQKNKKETQCKKRQIFKVYFLTFKRLHK